MRTKSKKIYDEVVVYSWDYTSVRAGVLAGETGENVALPEILGEIEDAADALFAATCEAIRLGYRPMPSHVRVARLGGLARAKLPAASLSAIGRLGGRPKKDRK